MKDLAHIIQIMWREKKDIWLTILFGFLAGMLGFSMFASSGYLISKAALLPPLYTLTVMLGLLKLISISRALSRYVERLVSHRGTFSILKEIRSSFFEKVERSIPSILNKYKSGDLLARIVGDVESMQNFFLRVVYPPIVFILVFLSAIFFMSFYSGYMSLSLLIGMIVSGIIVPGFFAWTQKKKESNIRNTRNEFSTEVTEFLYGFRDLKMYGINEEKAANLQTLSRDLTNEQAHIDNRSNWTQSINYAVSALISCCVLATGAYEVAQGNLDGIYLAMLVMISLNVFEYAVPMAAFPVYAEESRRAASRLHETVNKEPEKEVSDIEISNLSHSIELKNVKLYFEPVIPILDNISISFAAGSKTAIVGPSGSGKSTLLMLLMKLYSPDKGEITVNGNPIQEIESESLWRNMSIVLQENHFFFGTIRENLLISNENATDNEMESALLDVGLQYKNLNERIQEKGSNLSGGEKQKLAIARVLLRSSGLWLLDEPMSSIDMLAEQSILNKIFEKARNDTVILISHKLKNLEQMDQIIVMDSGRIVEAGSFEQLLSRKGYFYQLREIEKNVIV
ncbi:thiol reductant ABC exporter subunit CydC [Fictibacillus sp. 7GRE50]|uniref:thiol reductant ABC exporter subunit CydC n=1 Tax=unclassified Fictibacillus TaxID=2644029 RepID=UPI0018CD31C6|nr:MULTISPECIES: thiol reductant ABC exporter subunit CydC [unclassified Fictibacillus]MBH0166876.1 thiol reductant ABC exporter subunit CydC [Fictibacillus sp. 7GRE50]MBH0173502.1 thiol reductant ABC exporter subunit CydC [Fictibacillus sp. 23RED33]